LEKLIANGRLLCLDRDSAPWRRPRPVSAPMRGSRFSSRRSLRSRLCRSGAPGLRFDGILFDLGVLIAAARRRDARLQLHAGRTLDMRMTAGEGASAADIVNGAPERELVRIFREFARNATRRASRARSSRPPVEALRAHAAARRFDLTGLSYPRAHKHPATRVFQALRIHVNRELENSSLRWTRRWSAWRRTADLPSSVSIRWRTAWSSNSCAATR